MVVQSASAVAGTKAGRAKQRSDPSDVNAQIHDYAKTQLLQVRRLACRRGPLRGAG